VLVEFEDQKSADRFYLDVNAGGSSTQRLLRFSNGRPQILFVVHMLDCQTDV
jgi:hypothetical protein